jgi:hypothetical protein
MKNHKKKYQPISEPSTPSESQTSSLALILQQFRKEAEKKEAAEESAKVRCKVCFKEVAPQRRCFGHGGGGSGGSDGGSGKTSEEKSSPSQDQSLTKPVKGVETTNELIGEFDSMDDGEKIDSESSFDPEIIAELIAKGLLLVDSDRKSMTLTIKLLCQPNVLTEEQKDELKKFMEAIIKEFNRFKEKNHLSNDCIQIIKDEEGKIRSLCINLPSLALYDAFTQQLANNLVPIPRPKAQEKDENTEVHRFAPKPLAMEPKPSHSNAKEDVEKRREINKSEEELAIFNPSPLKMSPW